MPYNGAGHVGILAVEGDALLDLLSRGDRNVAAIDAQTIPAFVLTALEDFAEAADIRDWIAETAKNPFGALVGEGALDNLENHVCNRACLIEHDDQAPGLIVQARK